ncbi:MAG: response regulator [Candidatus Krumholzibacteriota bacterium]|nr:response regulator [Candidatus Krumholzibacteriota bacterium]
MKKKVLIVDDEVHLARILQFTLEHAGYITDTAFDGREALEKASTFAPDIVLLDLSLPVMDGYEVCKALKAGDKTNNISVVILSARDIKKEGVEKPLDADVIMEKPFNTENLLKELAKLPASV